MYYGLAAAAALGAAGAFAGVTSSALKKLCIRCSSEKLNAKVSQS